MSDQTFSMTETFAANLKRENFNILNSSADFWLIQLTPQTNGLFFVWERSWTFSWPFDKKSFAQNEQTNFFSPKCSEDLWVFKECLVRNLELQTLKYSSNFVLWKNSRNNFSSNFYFYLARKVFFGRALRLRVNLEVVWWAENDAASFARIFLLNWVLFPLFFWHFIVFIFHEYFI